MRPAPLRGCEVKKLSMICRQLDASEHLDPAAERCTGGGEDCGEGEGVAGGSIGIGDMWSAALCGAPLAARRVDKRKMVA